VSPYHIVLADDHVLLRRQVKRILASTGDLEVVGEAGDGQDLLDMLDKARPGTDMVILDISMPKLTGLQATRRIKRDHPGLKILILTVHRETAYLNEAFSAGAEGYLLKDDADRELFSAIEAIRGGGTYVSPFFRGRAGTA